MANAVFDVSKETKRVIALIKTGDYYAQNQEFDNAIRSYHRACSCFPVEYLTDKPDGLETLDETVQDDVKELHSIIYSRLVGCLLRRKPVWQCSEQLFGIEPSARVCGFNSLSDIQTSFPFPLNGPTPGINSYLGHVVNSTDDAAGKLSMWRSGSLTSQNEVADPNGLIPEYIVSKISSNEEPHLEMPKNQTLVGFCCICQQTTNIVVQKCCKGKLHENCLDDLKRSSNMCPYCRKPLIGQLPATNCNQVTHDFLEGENDHEEPIPLPLQQAFSEIQAEMDVYGENDPPDGALC
ncbi:uncharacterized protein LOC144657886 [Oculina patagonica]